MQCLLSLQDPFLPQQQPTFKVELMRMLFRFVLDVLGNDSMMFEPPSACLRDQSSAALRLWLKRDLALTPENGVQLISFR